MEVKIIFENKDIAVIHKPEGLIVHQDGVHQETLVDWILDTFPSMKDVGETQRLKTGEIIQRPGIVHRLDKDTSGIMVLAKNQDMYYWLKQSFKERQVIKTYIALVYGGFNSQEGVIEKSIGKSRSDFRMWSAQQGARGKLRSAKTAYDVIDTVLLSRDQVNRLFKKPKRSSELSKVSLLHLYPHTGRTHQIRVHLKALGKPVVNDSLYAESFPRLKISDRMYLHAHKLEIPIPSEKLEAIPQLYISTSHHGMCVFSSDIPEAFIEAGISLGIDKELFM
jgi:23S rRNA pseudouridine1911/1915/1917 synthase